MVARGMGTQRIRLALLKMENLTGDTQEKSYVHTWCNCELELIHTEGKHACLYFAVKQWEEKNFPENHKTSQPSYKFVV